MVTIQHCNCLKGPTTRVRDMLVAEGFQVTLRVTLQPGVLRVSVDGKPVWNWALWRRRIPDQKTLAQMVREKQAAP